MKKRKLNWAVILICTTLLLVILTSAVKATISRYASVVTKTATFEIHVNPQSSSAMNISTVTIKLHSNEDQSNKGKTDVIGEVVGFVNADGSPHLQSCPNVVPPTNDGFVFLGYYGFIGQNAVKVFDSTGKSVGTEVFDDVYALWTKIETE